MRRCFLLVICMVVCICSYAEKTAQIVLSPEEDVITFYYDDIDHSSEGTVYEYRKTDIPDKSKIKKAILDKSFADARFESTYKMFTNCISLTEIIGLEYLNTSETTDISSMFSNCKSLKSIDLSHFDTGKVKTMTYMFYNCESLTSIDLSSFNTKNVKTVWSMFLGCKNLKQVNLSSFDTSNIVNFDGMFRDCESLESIDVSNFDTKNAHDISNMFSGCKSLKSIDLSNFDTSGMRNIGGLFKNCESLTSVDLSNFNTEKATVMSAMFYGCKNLKHVDLSSFNTKRVKYFGEMFYGCESIELIDISTFSSESIEDMRYMFYNCKNLVSIFATTKFYPKLGGSWGDDVFTGCEKIVGETGFTYDEKKTSYYYCYLTMPECYFKMGSTFYGSTEKVQKAVISYDRNTITYYYDDKSHKGEGSVHALNNKLERIYLNFTKKYVNNAIVDKSMAECRPDTLNDWFCNLMKVTEIKGIEYLNTSNAVSMVDMFNMCKKIKNLDLSNFKTDKVKSMHSMFKYCDALESVNLSSFNTEKLETMAYMFYECASLKSVDMSNFDTPSLTSLDRTFMDCYSIESIDLSNMDTRKVSDFEALFANDENLKSIYVGKNFICNSSSGSKYMFDENYSIVGEMGTTFNEEYTDKEYARIDEGEKNPGYFKRTRKVTFTIGESGYTTLCSRYDNDFSDVTDFKAYVVNGYDPTNNTLTLIQVNDAPAGTGLLIKGKPGKYIIKEATSYTTVSSLLTGVTEDTEINQKDGNFINYVLAEGSEGIAFYKVDDDGGTLAENRAYLQLPDDEVTNAKSMKIVFVDNDSTTDINCASYDVNNDNSAYNLAGQKVDGSYKGIVIKNGKKIMQR